MIIILVIVSEEITLNTHGNMSLVAKNRYNDTITKTISISPAVSKTAEITVKGGWINSLCWSVRGRKLPSYQKALFSSDGPVLRCATFPISVIGA